MQAYNARLQLHAALNQPFRAGRVYQEMRAAGMRPDLSTFVHLFQVCTQPADFASNTPCTLAAALYQQACLSWRLQSCISAALARADSTLEPSTSP